MWGCSCGQLQHSSSFIWAGDAWLTAQIGDMQLVTTSDALCLENAAVLLDMNADAQNMKSLSSYERCQNFAEDLKCTRLDQVHGKVTREMC